MADRGPRTGYVIERPNRERASARTTRAVVVLLLLASAALVLAVTVGGWDKLVGARGLQVLYVALYVVLAGFAARWSRGALTVASMLAAVLLIFAAVAGPAWFDRDRPGYADTTIDAGILGMLTLLLVPLQVLLIGFALRGFRQAWHIEIERPADGGTPRGHAPAGDATAAA